MNEITINYNYSKSQKILSLIIGGYIILFGLYHCILLALDSEFNANFYLALVSVVLGVILLLNNTLCSPKPIFRMNSEMIYSHATNPKTTYQASWDNVKDVAIGISYLKMTEVDGKEYNVDLSALKYADLKEIKSRIIELCESKMISYKND